MWCESCHQMTPKVHNLYQNIEISINDDQKRSIDESQMIINDHQWSKLIIIDSKCYQNQNKLWFNQKIINKNQWLSFELVGLFLLKSDKICLFLMKSEKFENSKSLKWYFLEWIDQYMIFFDFFEKEL